MLTRLFAICGILVSSQVLAADNGIPHTLHFAAADWCPYTCNNGDHPGVITETVTEILAQNNIQLSVSVLPWSRAVKLAELGQIDGLLTAIESEAPQLALTQQANGHYQVCLFSEDSHHFVYHGRKSLQGIKLGAIQDYGYGEPIDSIIKAPREGESVYRVSNTNPLHSLVEMTVKGRIDTFAEDSLVLANYLQTNEKANIKNVGCLPATPFYSAISPKKVYHQALLKLLNTLYSSEAYRAIYQQTLKRYGSE